MIVKDKSGNEVEIEDSELEPIKAEIENKVKSEVGQELASAKERADELETANSGLVEQVKDLRKKKDPVEPADTNKAPVDVESEVEKILAKRREEESKGNLSRAIELFKTKNKLFHPENDPGGLKFSKVQNELSGLKTDSAYTVEDYLNIVDKAYKLAMPESQKESKVSLDPSTPSDEGRPQVVEGSKLTALEQKAIKKVGWTEERFLTLKASQPDYVRKLLADLASTID